MQWLALRGLDLVAALVNWKRLVGPDVLGIHPGVRQELLLTNKLNDDLAKFRISDGLLKEDKR